MGVSSQPLDTVAYFRNFDGPEVVEGDDSSIGSPEESFLRRNCWNIVSFFRCFGLFILSMSIVACFMSIPSSEFRQVSKAANNAIGVWVFDVLLTINITTFMVVITIMCVLPFGAYGASRKIKIIDLLINLTTTILLMTFGILLYLDLDKYIESMCGVDQRNSTSDGTLRASEYEALDFDCSEPSGLNTWQLCVCNAKDTTKYDNSAAACMISACSGGLNIFMMSVIIFIPRGRNSMQNCCRNVLYIILGSALIIGSIVGLAQLK